VSPASPAGLTPVPILYSKISIMYCSVFQPGFAEPKRSASDIEGRFHESAGPPCSVKNNDICGH